MASAYCQGVNIMAPLPFMALPCAIDMFYKMANKLKDKDPARLDKKSPKWVRNELKLGDKFRIGYWNSAIFLIKFPGVRFVSNKWAVGFMTKTAKRSLDLPRFYNEGRDEVVKICPVDHENSSFEKTEQL